MHLVLAIVVGAVIIMAALFTAYLVGRVVFFLLHDHPDDTVMVILAGITAIGLSGAVLLACGLVGSSIIGN